MRCTHPQLNRCADTQNERATDVRALKWSGFILELRRAVMVPGSLELAQENRKKEFEKMAMF